MRTGPPDPGNTTLTALKVEDLLEALRIERHGGWEAYVKAKRLVCGDQWLCNYEDVMHIITDYLGV
jgi:hypothetical protein